MSGKRYVLDTNAIIALFRDNRRLIQLLKNADWLGISVISQIEFLVFAGLTDADRQLFQDFLQRVDIIGLTMNDTDLIEKIIEIRQQYRLKLPDAVIVAMTIHNSASLITADQELMRIDVLEVINFTN